MTGESERASERRVDEQRARARRREEKKKPRDFAHNQPPMAWIVASQKKRGEALERPKQAGESRITHLPAAQRRWNLVNHTFQSEKGGGGVEREERTRNWELSDSDGRRDQPAVQTVFLFGA